MADEVLPKRVELVLRCEQCSTEYPVTHEDRICPNDAGKLIVADSDRVIGSVLVGRYAIESLIGIGGWSAVYLAQDRQLRRPVAIKVLHYHLRKDEESVKRFQRESLLTASLNHPHITTMFDFGLLANGQPFIVMEYLDGSTLDVLLGFEGHLSSRRTINLICQICDAMEYAHKKGLIHRDLKPSNVLLLDSDFVKIMDFGLAKCLDGMQSLTLSGNVVGTPTYMSPEQCRGDAIDGRSDLYCVGLLGVFMLTGRQPVQADSIYEAMHKHIADAPKRPSELRPDLSFSPALEDILLRCLKKNPSDRFQNCADLKSALQAHTLNVDREVGHRRQLLPILQNQSTAAIVSCALLLSGILVAFLFWPSGSRFQRTESRMQQALKGQEATDVIPPDTARPTINQAAFPPLTNAAQHTDEKAPSPTTGPLIQGSHLPKPGQKQRTESHLQSAPGSLKVNAVAERSPPPAADNRPTAAASLASKDLGAKAKPGTQANNEAAVSEGALIKAPAPAPSLFTIPAPTYDLKVADNRMPTNNRKVFVISDLPSSRATIAQLSSISDCVSLQILRSNVDDQVLAFAIERFPSLTKIALPNAGITDQGLALIGSSNISMAFLRANPITDAGLRNLQRSTKLVLLDLSGDQIGDSAIKNICTMPLQVLALNGTKITNESGEFLRKMPTLEALALEDTDFGDRGLQKIAKLPHLRELNCSQTSITDASMHQLARMPSLSVLGLAGTNVTDDGIAKLAMSSSLTRLDISNTAVTPAVIESILRVKNLDTVKISKVSRQMAESLRKAGIAVVEANTHFYQSGGMSIPWRVNHRR